MARHSSSAQKDSGQELIEFALVLFFVLIPIMFGVLDLGRAFHAAISIENAARVGARYGARNPGDDNDIRKAACKEAQTSGIRITTNCDTDPLAGLIGVEYPGGSSASGQPIRVTVTYHFELILGDLLPGLDNITMVRSAEMLIP